MKLICTGLAAAGRHGAVVVGDEGAVGVGRYGNVVVADCYESYDAWKVETLRIEAWRIEYAPDSLAASRRLIRDFIYRVDATAAPRS